MTHDEEYEQMIRECAPILEAMARQLGSWEALGEQIGRDLALHSEQTPITIPTLGNA